jgi:hypothetical protein
MVATDDGFAMVYTWSRKRIAFAEIKVSGHIGHTGRPNPHVEVTSGITPYRWEWQGNGQGEEEVE